MNEITAEIREVLEEAFEKAGYDRALAHVSVSDRPDLCEYQCNGAMALAKQAHRKPIDIANEVVAILKDHEAFAKVEACMPGFINMDLSERFLASYMFGMQESGNELKALFALAHQSNDTGNGNT